mgnify:CR=1 FL=1
MQAFFVTEGVQKPDYITPQLSPLSDPKVAGEIIIWKNASLTLKVENRNEEAVKPAFRFLGAFYDLLPITKQDVVKRIVAGKIPCRFESVLGVTEATFRIPDEWTLFDVSSSLLMEVM